MPCTSVTKVPYDANNENKVQTVTHDFKITTFRKLMSLNTCLRPKFTRFFIPWCSSGFFQIPFVLLALILWFGFCQIPFLSPRLDLIMFLPVFVDINIFKQGHPHINYRLFPVPTIAGIFSGPSSQ